MVAYGIGFLPLIKHLKSAYPDVTHTWYARDAGHWVCLITWRDILIG